MCRPIAEAVLNKTIGVKIRLERSTGTHRNRLNNLLKTVAIHPILVLISIDR